ncbi:transposase [Bacillus cereus]|uniref:transposase n=1 Tax=Bacillus cereus TaxID=1396 RepID=UPI0018CC9A1C|nr:transposase [Bacillus cereus]
MFKRKCVELVFKEGQTIVSVQNEFDLGHGTLNEWIKQYKARLTFPEKTEMEELRSLRRETQELKKAATFFASNHN